VVVFVTLVDGSIHDTETVTMVIFGLVVVLMGLGQGGVVLLVHGVTVTVLVNVIPYCVNVWEPLKFAGVTKLNVVLLISSILDWVRCVAYVTFRPRAPLREAFG